MFFANPQTVTKSELVTSATVPQEILLRKVALSLHDEGKRNLQTEEYEDDQDLHLRPEVTADVSIYRQLSCFSRIQKSSPLHQLDASRKKSLKRALLSLARIPCVHRL